MTEYNELRDGQEFYGNGYKQGYADAELKYNDVIERLKKYGVLLE